MKRYSKFIKPYLSAFILAPLFMTVEVFGEIILPKLMAKMIDVGIANSNTAYIITVGALMIGAAILMMICGICGCYFAARASISFSADLRADVFSKVQDFSFKNIDNFSTGSLVTRLTNDINQLQNVIRMALIMILRSPGMLIGAFIMAFSINSKLALVIAIVVPLLAISLAIIMSKAFPRFKIMQKKLDTVNSNIQENLTNIRVVKSFVRSDYEKKKFAVSNENLKSSTLNAMNMVILTMPVMTLAMNITIIAVLWFGGNIVISGSMAVGDLSAIITYITQILMALMMLSMLILQASRATASLNRISEVLDTQVDLNDDNAAQKDKVVKNGKIEFKNVCFKYNDDNDANVLENINFTANPGETVGIIGATGSGKTSLVSLIPRLYDCTQGQVLVDDVNVKDYSIKNLRDGVGMVLQKNVLFSGTINENLKWGNPHAEEQMIEECAKNAQADSFVNSFTNGYETELGQGGVNVSGGQKQRLCIARALLKKPKILILDDSTSAVDTATESKIRQSFSNQLKHTTKLIIAQRITSVMDADKIIVIDNGSIVAVGNHTQLMDTCEEYKEIYYSQKDKEVNA